MPQQPDADRLYVSYVRVRGGWTRTTDLGCSSRDDRVVGDSEARLLAYRQSRLVIPYWDYSG